MRAWLEEFLPLLVFFILTFGAHKVSGAPESENIYYATAGFMIALCVSLASIYIAQRRPTPMMLISAGLVLVFGGLTLLLHDERFIKIKPTIVYFLFASALAIGNWRDIPILRSLMGHAIPLTHAGWRVLSWRWAGLFCALAVLNELVWRNASTQLWVQFKVFAIPAIIFGFVLAQMPLFKRYASRKPG